MANTCTICRHKERQQIEDALARGDSLRHIASQLGVGYKSVERHQTCIAAELKALKALRSAQLNESLLQRLDRYRRVAEKFLSDDDKALSALDRCYKQVDLEAKLTGEYQKKQENQPDKQKRREIIVEVYKMIFRQRTRDYDLMIINSIHDARDDDARFDAAVRAAIEADEIDVDAAWQEAEQRVEMRESTMVH